MVNEKARNLLAAFATIGVANRKIHLNGSEIWYNPPRVTYRVRGRTRRVPAAVRCA